MPCRPCILFPCQFSFLFCPSPFIRLLQSDLSCLLSMAALGIAGGFTPAAPAAAQLNLGVYS